MVWRKPGISVLLCSGIDPDEEKAVVVGRLDTGGKVRDKGAPRLECNAAKAGFVRGHDRAGADGGQIGGRAWRS